MNKKIVNGAIVFIFLLFNLPVVAEDKINVNLPLVPEQQYFQYRNLHSSNVTLKSLLALDCDMLRSIYEQDPQRAIDHIGLVILVQKALEGSNIQTMSEEERINQTIAEIASQIKSTGHVKEVNQYLGHNSECKSIIPPVGTLCQVLESEKMNILREKYHYKMIFPQ